MATIVPEDDDPRAPTPGTLISAFAAASVTKPTKSSPTTLQPKGKLKRLRFIETYDRFLLRAVRAVDAHIPDRGQSEPLYQQVHKTFMEHVPPVVFTHLHQPSCETLVDRFKHIFSHRRETVKKTSRASGIIEKHGKKEVLVDDLISEMDEKEEAVRVENNEQTEKEKQLAAAGENIRDMALKRNSSSDARVDETSSENGSAKKRRRRQQESSVSDDEVVESILLQAEERRVVEKQRLELDAQRVDMERKRAEKETKRFEMMQNTSNRRLDLDEKRFEMDKEERKLAMEERE